MVKLWYILRIEPTVFADGLNVEYEKINQTIHNKEGKNWERKGFDRGISACPNCSINKFETLMTDVVSQPG